jgi:geranylgeranyl transferase type-2 subunit beta
MTCFHHTAHIRFITRNIEAHGSLVTMESFLTTQLKMGGIYWTLGASTLLRNPLFDSKAIHIFVNSCRNKDGGYGPDVNHDSHATTSHYALLILKMLGVELTETEKEETSNFFYSLQREDGGIMGDLSGECDMRFAYDAVASEVLLGIFRINLERLRGWIESCRNYDGGYAPAPQLESHAAYTFCAVGALSLSGGLGMTDAQETKTGWWLAERQTVHGGFNGRPEKAPDVCYSWWILSTLEIMGKGHWVDKKALRLFVLKAQDEEDGGIADRPGFAADIFHTFFGLAALALMGGDELVNIDAQLAVPKV